MNSDTSLTNFQSELLKLFSFDLSDKELQEVKKMLAKFFAERASKEMDKLWKERGWTNETMDQWLGKD